MNRGGLVKPRLWLALALMSALVSAEVRAGDTAAAANPPAPASPPAEPPRSSPAPQQPGLRPVDRLELDPTLIRGNQELPKVLYIVPWKEPGLAEPAGRPLGSLVDEALAPVDREVFRRQMRYFDQLYPGAKAAGADEAGAGGK